MRISDWSSDVCSSDLCRAARIAVFNTPEVLADSVADAALLLVLGAARRATESIRLIRSGAWAGWTPTQLNGVELRGETRGILGMGGLGQRVCGRSHSFGRRAEEPQIGNAWDSTVR